MARITNCLLMIFLYCSLLISSSQHYYCTAADEHYFSCLINLIGGIHKHNFEQLGEIMVFDLGLTQEQRLYLNSIQNLNVYDAEMVNSQMLIPFNTQTWGKYVPGWYTWKAGAIKQALEKYTTILWIDAGTTVNAPLNDLFEHIEYNGYFFHNGVSWSLQQETTQYVLDYFDLQLPLTQWSLNPEIKGVESGLMGLSRSLYPTIILPMYLLSKNIRNFEDDSKKGI